MATMAHSLSKEEKSRVDLSKVALSRVATTKAGTAHLAHLSSNTRWVSRWILRSSRINFKVVHSLVGTDPVLSLPVVRRLLFGTCLDVTDVIPIDY